jgi:hypothetical protein
MEPGWTKSISSETVCNFFYSFFIAYAIIFVLSILSLIGILSVFKLKTPTGMGMSLQMLLTGLLAAVNMLFNYLICDRALLSGK